MIYLLDVSALLSLLWQTHVFHQRTKVWADENDLALCPITELGFLRISTNTIGAEMEEARRMLQSFLDEYKPQFVPCDFSALNGAKAATGAKTTDFYLASLAEKHGMQFATLDENIGHQAAFLIPG